MTLLTKRTGRILFRSFSGLAGCLVVTLVLCFDTVDSRPYFRESYYTDTAARLEAAGQTNLVLRGELAAGFGRALLTPTLNSPQEDPLQGQFKRLPLAGYGSRRGHFASGVHDDLYVKAVALRVGDRLGVMLGVDALIIPPEVAESAAQQLAKDPGLRREQIYLSATHTHSGLGGWGEGRIAEEFAGTFNPGARTWFAARIVAAARAAVADLKPAAFGTGRFAA